MLRTAFVCTLSLLATGSLAQTTIDVGPEQAYTKIDNLIHAGKIGEMVLVASPLSRGRS